ncbi:MAG: signal peptidase I [Candidatus Endonucleobacter bathymodioli]|uniref:Signal peptidase I n=1 Tax=Candidatus Endonucleibacter bathymodioli TaxID=539814 RepID=A0AA90SRJ4_9GAMM|nr:signal peptidase I [Candidatus Endonucleobacter bathymodioli]
MDFNFPLLLVSAVFITGGIALFDRLILRSKRRRAVESYKAGAEGAIDLVVLEDLENESVVVETAISIFPVLSLVLILRSFLFEPFQIPSGSMIPTLAVGDFILVNKYAYGLRLPVVGTKIMAIGDPARGDVMVFKEPKNEDVNFIKRVIGLPGDVISYQNKSMTINGQPVLQKFTAQLSDDSSFYRLYEENIDGNIHKIRKESSMLGTKNGIWEVPQGHYFVMGDNRDRSNDSRYWGFVPEQNIVGKAVYIWMSWLGWRNLPGFKNNGAIE